MGDVEAPSLVYRHRLQDAYVHKHVDRVVRGLSSYVEAQLDELGRHRHVLADELGKAVSRREWRQRP